jgi:hypothetical protein
LSWLPAALAGIPPDSESEKGERKARKYAPYEVLADIPGMIRNSWEGAAKQGVRQLAVLVRDELLLLWITTPVWRQRNIRECRIGHNLFKGEIPPLVNIAIPEWAQERLRVNPREKLWQFYFREGETKTGTRTGHEVRSILPRRLVPLLEEYLEHYRPALLRGSDPATLFVNGRGNPFKLHTLTQLVGNLTLRYAHRRVTPHVFRDIFAYWWLDHHPEDYLTLSKVLWHSDINTTIRTYGGKYDESHGLRRLEEYLDANEKEPEYLAAAGAKHSGELAVESNSKQAQLQPEDQAREALPVGRKKRLGGMAA